MPKHSLAAVAVLLLAGACGTRVDVPAPAAGAASRPLAEPEASVVHLPLTLALDSLIPDVEDAVPRGERREDEWHPLGDFPVVGTLYVKEMWERDPLRLHLSGDQLDVATRVRYRARVAERVCVPVAGCSWVPLAACGHDGPMPSLEVGLRTTVAWRPDWSVVPRTTARPVEAGVRCRLTRARVDVTDRVRDLVQKKLDEAAPRLDDEIREEVALRRRVEEVWATLNDPIDADDGVFLLLRPESVALAAPSARGMKLSTVVSLTLRPKVVIGDRPAAGTAALPDFGAAVPGRGFRISLTAELPYDAATRLVQDAVVGKELDVQGHTVRVRGVRLYGSGDRVVLGVKVSGDARGTVYFVGTPRYDAAGQVVTVPDLDFSVETRNVVGGAAGWLLHDLLRDRLREAARFPVGERLAELQEDVNEAMNRNLSRGVRLSGGIETVRPVGVQVTPRALAAVVEAGGSARIDIVIR